MPLPVNSPLLYTNWFFSSLLVIRSCVFACQVTFDWSQALHTLPSQAQNLVSCKDLNALFWGMSKSHENHLILLRLSIYDTLVRLEEQFNYGSYSPLIKNILPGVPWITKLLHLGGTHVFLMSVLSQNSAKSWLESLLRSPNILPCNICSP